MLIPDQRVVTAELFVQGVNWDDYEQTSVKDSGNFILTVVLAAYAGTQDCRKALNDMAKDGKIFMFFSLLYTLPYNNSPQTPRSSASGFLLLLWRLTNYLAVARL